MTHRHIAHQHQKHESPTIIYEAPKDGHSTRNIMLTIILTIIAIFILFIVYMFWKCRKGGKGGIICGIWNFFV